MSSEMSNKEVTMENKPKVKEHFVPKFYLRNFTSKNKKICIYDKIENKMYFKAPQNICYINDLYETKWIDENLENNNYILRNDLENHFSEIEKEFNNTLNSIISKCSCQQNQNKLILTSYEKEIMKKFVANILFRNPWCMKQYNVDSVDENLLENPEICKIQHELGIDVAPLIKASNKLCLFDDRFDSSLVKKNV